MPFRRPAMTRAVLAAALATSLAAAHAGAQTYDLSWYTIDGGGGTSSGGVFVLSGTIGQPDAGTMTGGIYELRGGFWPGAAGMPTGCNVADIVSIGGSPPPDGLLTGDD